MILPSDDASCIWASDPRWFCTQTQAAQVGAAAAVVLVQCKRLRIAAAYTHCEPAAAAAASLTLITAEGDITISKGAAGGTVTHQQCKSHTGRSFTLNK